MKPHHSIVLINRHITQQMFILNGIWSILAMGGIPTKLKNLPVSRFLRPLQWRQANTEVLQMQQKLNMNLYTLN